MSTERCYQCGVWGLSTKDCCGYKKEKNITVGDLIDRLTYLDRHLNVNVADIVLNETEVIIKLANK